MFPSKNNENVNVKANVYTEHKSTNTVSKLEQGKVKRWHVKVIHHTSRNNQQNANMAAKAIAATGELHIIEEED